MPKDEIGGWLTAEYSLLPTSTNTRCQRERTKLSGRTQEIQRLIGRSLRACLDLKALGDITITIDADVIQADGGTRVASICGGFVALQMLIEKLMLNGELIKNPIIEPVGAVSAGISKGEVILDLNYDETNRMSLVESFSKEDLRASAEPCTSALIITFSSMIPPASMVS